MNGEVFYRDLTRKIWYHICKWGEINLRTYPWRKDFSNMYNIFIAEILLHRTRADQVKPVYESFIKKYPDFKSIADSSEEHITRDLYSLGLGWRAAQLYKMSEEIEEKYKGVLPKDLNKLIEFPGVGPYIASATLCFVYNENIAVLDTNIVRVIGRLFGIPVKDSSRKSRKFKSIMFDIISYGEPRKFTLSLIDFAALICRSQKPKCGRCPLADICNYYLVNNLHD